MNEGGRSRPGQRYSRGVEKENGGKITYGLVGLRKDFSFYIEYFGKPLRDFEQKRVMCSETYIKKRIIFGSKSGSVKNLL